jgi:hypothetical protein
MAGGEEAAGGTAEGNDRPLVKVLPGFVQWKRLKSLLHKLHISYTSRETTEVVPTRALFAAK